MSTNPGAPKASKIVLVALHASAVMLLVAGITLVGIGLGRESDVLPIVGGFLIFMAITDSLLAFFLRGRKS